MTNGAVSPAVLHSLESESRVWDEFPFPSMARRKELIEQAIVDAYCEEEQVGGFVTMNEEYRALPFRGGFSASMSTWRKST
jgi:hypothetical protein